MQESPAAHRNRLPILEVLRGVFRRPSLVLEVGSGTGQHAACFANAMPGLVWQPTERDPSLFASIEAWAEREGVAEPRPPFLLDATDHHWPTGPFDGVFSANMIHIAPWAAGQGLVRGAAACLRPGGTLVLYGPFRIDGRHTAASNDAFDLDLRRRNPAWGVRDLEVVESEAATHGLVLADRIAMPANNQILLLRRTGAEEGDEGRATRERGRP